LGLRGIREQRSGQNYIMRSLMITKYHSGDQIEKHKVGGARSTNRERRGVYRVLVGKPDRDHLEDPGADGRNIRMDLQEVGWGAWTGLIWLRRGTGGGHAWMR
jgi:hypothetical protein